MTHDPKPLDHLAGRCANDPYFLVPVLTVYQQRHGLDDAGLAAMLGCDLTVLTQLHLCRRPGAAEPGRSAEGDVVMCGARGRSGLPYRKAGMMPSGRCGLHGGMTPHGISSPHFKGGEHSKYLPKGLKTTYDAALVDPQLTSLRKTLAMMQAREVELIQQMSKAKGPPWGMVVEYWNDCILAARSKNKESRKVAARKLNDAIRKGFEAKGSYEAIWKELRQLYQERTKTACAEHQRLADLNALIPVEDVLSVMVAFLSRIRNHVSDRKILQRIQQDWNELVGARCSPEKRKQIANLPKLGQEVVEGTAEPPTATAQQPLPVGPQA
jgi:hypothetical protein